MPHEDVRFLLVHHSATSNDVPDPRSLIRGIYAFHTSSAKRWPDVAYNFFVAPDGSVWEGRAGSIDGPVAADATGGNQGYSQLVCLLGNHVDVPPTAAAQTSLTRTLAWMAGRFSLNTYADASTTFVSRGSNKFPAGTDDHDPDRVGPPRRDLHGLPRRCCGCAAPRVATPGPQQRWRPPGRSTGCSAPIGFGSERREAARLTCS